MASNICRPTLSSKMVRGRVCSFQHDAHPHPPNPPLHIHTHPQIESRKERRHIVTEHSKGFVSVAAACVAQQ